jgi:hypothetical protein
LPDKATRQEFVAMLYETQRSEVEPDVSAPEFPVQFCPVCSLRLESRHCKMICPQCGYFISCSDYE